MQLKTAVDPGRRLGSTLLQMRCCRHLFFATLGVAALLPAVPATAIDATRPAQLRLKVCDDEGQVLPDTRITVSARAPRWRQKPENVWQSKTDAGGTALVQRQRPEWAAQITWSELVVVEREGYLPARESYTLFPGAQREITITLEAVRTTRIRLRGPRGKPLPGVELAVSYAKKGTRYTVQGDPKFFVTDEQGECVWRHGKLEDGFHLSGRPYDERFEDAPVVTVTYEEGDLPFAARRVEGKLLHADGSVAAGWLVARKVRCLGGYGIIPGPMWNGMQVEDLNRVGSDGRFEVEAKLLVVVSPTGMPLLYPLNPQTWPPGERHVTLRLPEVRHVHRGVVVDEAGKAVSGLRIDASRVGWDGQLWDFNAGKVLARAAPLWKTRATDGTALEPILTDAQGRYTLRTYFGSTPKYRPLLTRGWLKDTGGLAKLERNIWKRGRVIEPERFKVVTLVFQDEQGRRIPGARTYQTWQYAAGKPAETPQDGWNDTRGQHLFIDQTVDQLRLEIKNVDRKWQPMTTTIDVAGPDDRVVHVTLNETLRLKPLTGQLLDPDGAPVRNARVYLYRGAAEKRDMLGNDYLRLKTETNEQGTFSFAAAPNACYIEVRRSRRQDDDGSLPGWTTPVPVDERTRHVVIRLQRGGSVKAFLPAGTGDELRGFYLQREDAADDVPSRLHTAHFEHDTQRDELLTDILRPGWHRLSNYEPEFTEAMAAFGPVRVEVKTGRQSVIDLRSFKTPKRLLPKARPKSWTTVVVKRKEQVISGADVAVYAPVARPEDLTRWLQQWQDDRAAVREAALKKLKSAGALTIDALRTAGEEHQYEELLKRMAKVRNDGLHRVAFDLSDDRGTVRCELETGQNCVAVARVRGRMIGWQAFQAKGQTVTVDLRPARTLVVRLKDVDAAVAEYGLEWARIRLEEPSGPGIRALVSALSQTRTTPQNGGYVGRDAVFDHQSWLRNDRSPEWIMEDLPVGAVCTVTLPELPTEDDPPPPRISGRITIQPGNGVQTVEW